MSEFARLVRLDELGSAPRRMTIEAGADERAALRQRFGLVAVGALRAELALVRAGVSVSVTGRMVADVTQSCVVTAEALETHVDEPLVLRFEPEDGRAAEEVELDAQDLDVIGYAGGAIDVGEAVAQGLVLALDAFPRAPQADSALREAGVLSDDEVRPVSPLAAALTKLGA